MDLSNYPAAHVSPTGHDSPVQPVSRPSSYLASHGSAVAKVMADVAGHPCESIVDTGSANTVVSQKLLRRLGLLDAVNTPMRGTFGTASGQSASIWGTLPDFPVGIRALVIPITAHVTEAMSYDVLIGMDWLIMAAASIDRGKQNILFRQGLDQVITVPLIGNAMCPTMSLVLW